MQKKVTLKITHMLAIFEEEEEGEKAVTIPSGMFDSDDEFTTKNMSEN